jgi:hypothetical protein
VAEVTLVFVPAGALLVALPTRPAVAIAALGATAVGLVEVLRRASFRSPLVTIGASALASVAVVAGGATLGGTGVFALGVVGAIGLIVAVTASGPRLHWAMTTIVAAGLFALAAFGGQDGLATLAVAVTALAFGAALLEPYGSGSAAVPAWAFASSFALGAGAVVLDPVSGAARGLTTPLTLLALVLLDAAIVVVGRYRARVPVSTHRDDHLADRLRARRAGPRLVVVLLAGTQVVIVVIALFCGRAVWPSWVAVVTTLLVLVLLGPSLRGAMPAAPPHRSVAKPVLLALLAVGLVLIAAAIPGALFAPGAYHAMQSGREHATHGLQLARDGRAQAATAEFRAAERAFADARSKLDSPLMLATLGVPYVASNVRAARALSKIGVDLADAGTSVAVSADPHRLAVVGGRLPLHAVRDLAPKLARGSDALDRALARLETIRNDPYLASPVRDAVDKVDVQLVRARREANNAAAAAVLAPALFGGNGDRSYLVVMQNNAESRATGGLIGSYAVLTAHDGKLSIGPVLRTATWNNAVRAAPDPTLDAPLDYKLRYGQFQPATNLQNVNLSPDFPTVGSVLMGLAPDANVGRVDGVLSVDPVGLAALLRLTGPVEVASWPDPIGADNVVQVTLSEAYAAYPLTPDRADFLGDVARAAVDVATNQNLGTPASLAKTLGGAAHEGHIILAFARPAEQRLSDRLGVGMEMAPVRSDAIAVTSSNAAGNKIDYYVDRRVDYHVDLRPALDGKTAQASGVLTTRLTNNAPAAGLPESVVGPSDPRFLAGESRSYVSLYSPLSLGATTVDGATAQLDVGREVGRNVGSLYTVTSSGATSTIATRLVGTLALHDGWYELQIRRQPTLNVDHVSVDVEVPSGWRIDQLDGLKPSSSRSAGATLELSRDTTVRVHLSPVRSALSIWDKLRVGGA